MQRRLRFSLRTLILTVLFLGSLPLLQNQWTAWKKIETIESIDDDARVQCSDDRRYMLLTDQASNCRLLEMKTLRRIDLESEIGHSYPETIIRGNRMALVQKSSVEIFDVETGRRLSVIEAEDAFAHGAIDFFPNMNSFIIAVRDQPAYIWSFETKKAMWTAPALADVDDAGYSHVSVSADGLSFLTFDRQFGERVWETATYRELFQWNDDRELVSKFYGSSLLIGCGRPKTDALSSPKVLRVRDAKTGKALSTAGGNDQDVRLGLPFPDLSRILVVYENGKLSVMDLQGRELEQRQAAPPVMTIFIAPSGARVLIDDGKRNAKLLDDHLNEIAPLPLFYFVDFSPDGERFLSVDGADIRVFSVSDGAMLATFKTSNESTKAFFSPDGRRIVAADADSRYAVWERGRAEPFYGILTVPEFLLSAAFMAGLAISIIYDHKARGREVR